MSHNPVSMETFFSALFIFDMIFFVTIETEPKPSTLQLAVLHPLVGVFIGPVWRSLFWLLQVFYLLSKQGYQSPFSLVPLVIQHQFLKCMCLSIAYIAQFYESTIFPAVKAFFKCLPYNILSSLRSKVQAGVCSCENKIGQ